MKRPIGNLLEQDIATLWNGPIATELRKSVLNNSFHNCKRTLCPFLISRSEPVFSPAEAPRGFSIKTSAPSRINLCFDHSCNLYCPSCRPQRQMASQPERQLNQRIVARIIDQLLPTAEEITLSGFGDPFASASYMTLLRHLNASPTPPQLRLHSNGQLWTEQRWSTLPNLHRSVSQAEISIDAASHETYNINRPGGSFERLLDNLNYLSTQPFALTLSMVVQDNNFAEIPAFIELAENYGAQVYLSRLINWGTFTRDEYFLRAVHLSEHPRHKRFKTIMTEAQQHPRVNPGNLLSIV